MGCGPCRPHSDLLGSFGLEHILCCIYRCKYQMLKQAYYSNENALNVSSKHRLKDKRRGLGLDPAGPQTAQ